MNRYAIENITKNNLIFKLINCTHCKTSDQMDPHQGERNQAGVQSPKSLYPDDEKKVQNNSVPYKSDRFRQKADLEITTMEGN